MFPPPGNPTPNPNRMKTKPSATAAILAGLALPAAHAAVILEVNFNHLPPGNVTDGALIQDVSGNGYHGFWGGGVTRPAIEANGGIAIDNSAGGGKVFLRPNRPGIPEEWDGPGTTITPYFTLAGDQSHTFEAILNWNETDTIRNGIMGQTGGSQFWWREHDGFLHYAIGAESGTNANLFSNMIDISAAKTDSQWHHLALVYDITVGEIRTYVDYTLVHTNNDPDIGSIPTMLNGTSDFFLGGYNTTSSEYFSGLQDRYRISGTALSPAEFMPIPEPSTALLGALGTLALLRRRTA